MKNAMRNNLKRAAVLAAALALVGCGASTLEDINTAPAYLGAIQKTVYDGATNDLLTAGLGKTKLALTTPPAYADALNPTAAELRISAIHSNYRAMVDMSASGGYGSLYGPNIDINGNPTLGEGMIAGEEHVAYSDDGTGQINVTMMVQIPASFDKNNPCIVTGTSSGSRGVYGAIGTSGDWGLKHGCAVAYTDKGSGVGFHDLQNDTVNLQSGMRGTSTTAGKNSNFTAKLSGAELAAFNAATPNRFAIKQAHSQQNSEKDWGKYTLQAIEVAFYVLNQKFGALALDGTRHLRTIKPENTIVIAASASNGAGAALMALEQDSKGLIDGLAVSEPVSHVAPASVPTIKRGAATVNNVGKSLLDYVTLANIYQPCAALSTSFTHLPFEATYFNSTFGTNRCTSLKAKGLLTAATTATQADEALAKLKDYGWEDDHDVLQASHYVAASPVLAMMYSNMYGRFSVKDNLCGYSLGATDATTGAPMALSATATATLFSSANGTPTGGVNLINNGSAGGAIVDSKATSASTGVQDYGLDGALCFRSLFTGTDTVTGVPLTGASLTNSQAIRAGITEVYRTGNLHGKPAIIVHGRSDTLVPVNHNSRAYLGANKMVEGSSSKLSYIEVTNAQHFDSFIPTFGYDSRIVPTHHYLVQALDKVYANLKTGAALPPSQVVRTVPRGGASFAAPAITLANLPAIQAAPVAADQITVVGNVVTVPN